MAGQTPALDDGLFATFTATSTTVSFVVCGSTGDTSGCYGSPFLSPPSDHMMLYVYERKDVIANGNDSVTSTLKKTIDLGITGGSSSHCMIAGNNAFVYASTNVSSGVAAVSKSGYSVQDWSGTPVSTTADDRGYVAFNFNGSFDVVDPNGNGQEDGGGRPLSTSAMAG